MSGLGRGLVVAVLAGMVLVPAGRAAGGGAPRVRPPEGAGASGRGRGLRELTVRTGFGDADRADVEIVPLLVSAGWLLPDVVDAPLARWGLDLEYVLEGWVAGARIEGRTDAIEVGINPLAFRLAYDVGQHAVPYVSGGLGVLYTGLQGIGIGGPFEFDETAGVGLALFFDRRLAIDLGYRFRHISNAGISSDNRGLNTHFGLVGVSFFPGR